MTAGWGRRLSYRAGVKVRLALPNDDAFVLEMARYASTLEGRDLPGADDPGVLALLPNKGDVASIACDDEGRSVGAAWWHFHDPSLICATDGRPLPELAMAVSRSHRQQGVGTALVEVVAARAAERFEALSLNVHLLNPAVRLYVKTGFRVAGSGRGWYGVAMVRALR
jgi:GNAT superfamily N-acetyltransferase